MSTERYKLVPWQVKVVNDLVHAKRALSPEMISHLQVVLGGKEDSLETSTLCAREQNNEYRKRAEKWVIEDQQRFLRLRKEGIEELRCKGINELSVVSSSIALYYDDQTHMLNQYAYNSFEHENGVAPAYGVLKIEPDYSSVKDKGYWSDKDVDYLKLGELVAEWESEHPRVGIFIRYHHYYVVLGESQRAISNALRDLKQRLDNNEHKTATTDYMAYKEPVVFRFSVRYGIGGTEKEAESVCFNRQLRGSVSPASARSQLVTETQEAHGLPRDIPKPVHERHASLGNRSLETITATLTWLGGLLISVGILFCCFVIAVLFVLGGAWVSSKLLPLFVVVSSVIFVLVIFAFLPLAIPRATRGGSIIGLFISSWVFGITLWMKGLLLSLSIWGIAGVIIGLGIAGVGVVPIAMLATLTHGMWGPLMELVLLTVMTLGTGIGAALLAGTQSG